MIEVAGQLRTHAKRRRLMPSAILTGFGLHLVLIGLLLANLGHLREGIVLIAASHGPLDAWLILVSALH